MDIVEEFFAVIGVVGGHSNKHFVHDDSKEVPVDCLAVAAPLEHFGGEVGHAAAEGASA